MTTLAERLTYYDKSGFVIVCCRSVRRVPASSRLPWHQAEGPCQGAARIRRIVSSLTRQPWPGSPNGRN
jgi:hypothetical protein